MKIIFNKSFSTLILFFIPFLAQAYDFELDGIYYNVISSEKLQVGITNNTPSSSGSNTNSSYSGNIDIPSVVRYNNKTYTVTSIQSYAFGGLYSGSKIEKINIPSSIITIENSAFEYCSNLVALTGGENISSIGNNAFYGCSLLRNFDFGENLVTIGNQAFCKCYSLPGLIFSDSLTSIGEKAFYYATNIKYVVFGDNLRNIDYQAFAYCDGLSEVFFTSSSVPIVSNNAFPGNKSLSIYVPSSETYGFGNDYITFLNNSFQYSGKENKIDYVNNLKSLQNNISTLTTEINAGDYDTCFTVEYTGYTEFTVDIPFRYTITRKPLLIRVNNAERAYGEENPVFTSIAYGFVENENFENFDSPTVYLCSADSYTAVGSYVIVPVIYTKNYEVTSENGTLTISPAKLTVKANDIEVLYGDVIPNLTLSYSGFRNNENENVLIKKPIATTTATQSSPIGDYPIKVSGGEAKNYVFEYKDGTLSILKTLGVSVNNQIASVSLSVNNGTIHLLNKSENELCHVYDLDGNLIRKTTDSEISNLPHGIYIIKIGSFTAKITI